MNPGDVAVYPAGNVGTPRPSAVIAGAETAISNPSGVAVDDSGRIYVANQGPRSWLQNYNCFTFGPGNISVYQPGSTGDAKPISIINGSNTEIGVPLGLTVDSSGNIYVLNESRECEGESIRSSPTLTTLIVWIFGGAPVPPILVFAAGSDGDVAPVATIGGPFTALSGFSAIALGPPTP